MAVIKRRVALPPATRKRGAAMRVETSSYFPPVASAADLRRMAMQCAAQANMPDADETERDRLLKMREALLSLAANEDWLNGKSAG